MAATTAKSAHGTLMKLGDAASPEAFATILEVMGISGPSSSATKIDVSNQDSPEAWKEYITGMLDAGEITFDINWQPNATTHGNSTGGINWWFTTRRRGNMQLIFPTPSGTYTAAFVAIVIGFAPSADMDAQVKASVTIAISGKITWS